jgi:general secretion pathway protein E
MPLSLPAPNLAPQSPPTPPAAPPPRLALPPVPAPLSRAFLLHHRLCPKDIDRNGELIVATTNQSLTSGLADIEAVYGRKVITESVSGADIDRMIERLAQSEIAISPPGPQPAANHLADARDLANQPPVIRYVNILVRDAYEAAASDIHLESTAAGLLARYRVDGALRRTESPPADLHLAVLSRIKLLANLDIAERRKPQDGRIRVRLDARELDLRVSTIPTIFGESVVLRLLDHGGRPATLDALGMSPATLAHMIDLSTRAHGMVLVTGPTGSGKTTTLYAALLRRQFAAEKVITVEDPIEYELPGITQMPVQRESGVTFGAALRAILRQDPDVFMIGEMRDAETAEIATQSAMTGHLVFTTLHTNDAIGAVPRMLDLGVPEYVVAATIEGVLAQRLVRRICDHCRASYRPEREMVRRFPAASQIDQPLTRGAGCDACRGTGYRGRVGIFELIRISDVLRDAIAGRTPISRLRALALEGGMVTMAADGWEKVRAGITTIDEVSRAVQA